MATPKALRVAKTTIPDTSDAMGDLQDVKVGGANSGSRSGALVNELAEKIHAQVMTGTIPIGSWLRQEALARTFNVSRTPVREALRKLEADGLLKLVPRRGALVRGPTAREIREAYRVRAELEGLAAELAVEVINREQLARLGRSVQLFRSSVRKLAATAPSKTTTSTNMSWDDANTLFHEIVLEAAGNERLRSTVLNLHRTVPRNLTWAALRDNVRLLQENVAQHERILDAIEGGDALESRRLMTDHIRRAGELVADWFERQAVGL
jgi:DNA-binding GntR family transcriptional regulator